MQPAFSTPIAQPHIPAWGELSKNSRLGFTSNNPALYLGHNVCNSTTALGLQSSLLLNRVRSFCSGEQYDSDLGLYYLRARYYNPTTGRFMSRDPQDNSLRTPNDLHKYLYANGDPVNGWDPTGRGDLVELDVQFTRFLKKAPTLAEWGIQMVDCILAMANEIQDLVEEPDVRISKDSAAEVGVTCGLFFFNSFRLIYAMAP
jgi:RHS repeat-associated protein